MFLSTIAPEDLTEKRVKEGNVFVGIPFLYEPVFLELKRLAIDFSVMALNVNLENFTKLEVLLSLLRFYGIPENLSQKEAAFILKYQQFEITISFALENDRFSGEMICQEEILRFSSSMPYIARFPEPELNPVYILPEGTGKIYQELDKKESENEKRESIIGKPSELLELTGWLNERLHG